MPPSPSAHPDSDSPAAVAPTANPAPVLSAAGRDKSRLDGPAFWIGYLLVLAVALALRTYRIDMPPFDFPADRQKTWMLNFAWLRTGASLFETRQGWMELMFLPWLAARTYPLAERLGLEVWTYGRAWSVLFGTLTVALAPFVAARAAGSSCPRRHRLLLGLIFMILLAVNPYHLRISRMLTTEPITLAFQMAGLLAFFVALDSPRRWWRWIVFSVLLALSGLAKLPSVIWIPGYALALAFMPGMTLRRSLLALLILAAGVTAIFTVYGINPFTIFARFAQDYPRHFAEAATWMPTIIWHRSFVGMVAMMVTLPGLVLATIGLFTAPLVFRVTFLVFLGLFFLIVNLNAYNFCHVIIPGTALAAWGLHTLLRVAIGSHAMGVGRAWLWARGAAGMAILAIVLGGLYQFGPKPPYPPRPRGEVIWALQAVADHIPPGARLASSDVQGSFPTLAGRRNIPYYPTAELATVDYYVSLDRLSHGTLENAKRYWVDRASLPGESNALLYSKTPDRLNDARAGEFVTLEIPAARSDTPVAAVSIRVPRELYDPESKVLRVERGTPFQLEIEWSNSSTQPLVGMQWWHDLWKRKLPVPIRAGGFSYEERGVLCLPADQRRVLYTFELPEGFPAGSVGVSVFPVDRLAEPRSDFPTQSLPFRLQVEAPQLDPTRITKAFRELYPLEHEFGPTIWSDDWFYRDMECLGYRQPFDIGYLYCLPSMAPGSYQLSIEAAAFPHELPWDPELRWPSVEVSLPGDHRDVAKTLTFDHRATTDNTTSFTATQSFDSVQLNVSASAGLYTHPVWSTAFAPHKVGKQSVDLRRVSLQPLESDSMGVEP